EDKLKEVEKASGVVNKAGQVQIIIGPNVNEAYNDFLEVSSWGDEQERNNSSDEGPKNTEKNSFMDYLNKFGNFMAAVFMPIVPALITGGIILATKNLLINYFGMDMESGTAVIIDAIFDAA